MTKSIPEKEAKSEGVSPKDAFSILGNEIRLNILLALWEAPRNRLTFSEIRERANVPDPGNLNYHLTKLAEHFIRRTEDGYELRYGGEQVIRAVLAGMLTEDPVIGPVQTDVKCPFCGSRVEIQYAEDQLTVRCTNCVGIVAGDYPSGTYMSYPFPPAGLENRSPEEVVSAAHTFYDAKITPMMEGVCPGCACNTTRSIDICERHDGGDGRICEHCQSVGRIWAEYTCAHCKYKRRCLVWFELMNHPSVISFFHEYGDIEERIPFRKLTWENARYFKDISETVVSAEPLRIRVTIPFRGRKLNVTVDDELNVIDLSQ